MNDEENKISCYSDRFCEKKIHVYLVHTSTQGTIYGVRVALLVLPLGMRVGFTHQFMCRHLSPASEVPGRTLHGVLVICTRKEIRNDINQFPLTAETQMEMAFGPYCLLEGHS